MKKPRGSWELYVGASAVSSAAVQTGINEYFSYVNPEQSFDSFNTQLTGISAETVSDAPTFPELWKQIEGTMSSGILVAHNAQFDLSVLKACLQAYHINWKEKAEYCCTVQIGRRVLPGISHRLNEMCGFYGIALDYHKADSDSHAAAEILLRYMSDGVEIDRYLKTWRMSP